MDEATISSFATALLANFLDAHLGGEWELRYNSDSRTLELCAYYLVAREVSDPRREISLSVRLVKQRFA